MSLKANIEVAVNFSWVRILQFHKIGYISYRMALFYRPITPQHPAIFFTPYAIMTSEDKHFGQQNEKQTDNNKDNNCKSHQTSLDDLPVISQDSKHYISRPLPVEYLNDRITDNNTVYFKAYIDVALLNSAHLYARVDLHFSETKTGPYEEQKSFEARIIPFSGIFSYFPISFDAFETLSIAATYHATILEYKFQRNEQQKSFIGQQYESFNEYLSAVTHNYRYSELMQFYSYYRQSLQHQLDILQQRHIKYLQFLQMDTKTVKLVKLSKNKNLNLLFQQMYNKKFTELTMQQKGVLVEWMLEDFLTIKAYIYSKWTELNEFIRSNSRSITIELQASYTEQARQRLKADIFSHRIRNHDWTFSRYDDSGKGHIEQAQHVKKKSVSEEQLWKLNFPIENTAFFGLPDKSIKIFEQIYQTTAILPNEKLKIKKNHLIILVHGFQASKADLLPLKYAIQSKHSVRVHISICNAGRTEDSIESMGKRLAIQTNKLVESLMNKKASTPVKISFIGHSMGGIIIRAALQYIQLKDSLHAYISICTPHLGYLYSPSKIVKAGLWLLNTWQKCESISQISMQQHPNLRQTLLYKLALRPGLKLFKKIALFASSQDEYVPYESARIQKNAQILTGSLKSTLQSAVICQMVDNMLCDVQTPEISRLDVVFNIEDRSFDSWIGRTAHVKFLGDQKFINQFVISLDRLFL